MLPRIFNKLETDPGKDRTGLGLAIVKQIIEAHGGAVSVESTPGAGATFTFTLPPAAAYCGFTDVRHRGTRPERHTPGCRIPRARSRQALSLSKGANLSRWGHGTPPPFRMFARLRRSRWSAPWSVPLRDVLGFIPHQRSRPRVWFLRMTGAKGEAHPKNGQLVPRSAARRPLPGCPRSTSSTGMAALPQENDESRRSAHCDGFLPRRRPGVTTTKP